MTLNFLNRQFAVPIFCCGWNYRRSFVLLFFILCIYVGFSQPGKSGLLTVNSSGFIINQYALVTTSVSIGSNTLMVAPGPSFSLCSGDLIMIYQAQGASIGNLNTAAYGDILNYHSAGLYEFKYVQSISGNVITVQSSFSNSYDVISGRTQLVKVPQFSTLTINANASIAAKPWKDTVVSAVPYRFGGIVVVHANTIVNNGTITASFCGFRGGPVAGNQPFQLGPTDYVSPLAIKGGVKGESIAGDFTDYDLIGGRFCRGAPANGGGGGTSTNASGGGGANGFNSNAWNGQGVMVVDANNPFAAWSLDPGFIANGNSLTNSSGGGRGGYSWGEANMNATITPPGSGAWLGDQRREVGGLGGRALTNINAESRIYFGGGGGAGDANNDGGTAGGNGGGIVYLIAGTSITGAGVIESDGAAVPVTTCNCNGDGQGGGGGGGSIVIKAGSIANTQTVNCRGGRGGDQLYKLQESEGGGGGGGGGFSAISTGLIIPDIDGGPNGVTNSAAVSEMISNGGTKGASGQIGTVSAAFVAFIPPLITGSGPVCAGGSLSYSVSGIGAGVASYSWTGPGNLNASLPNPVISGVSLNNAGTLTLTITYTDNCILTSTTDLVVLPSPSVVVSSNAPGVCAGKQVQLTATGASQYTWLPQNINNFSIAANPASSTTYTVVGSNTNNCVDTTIFVQAVYPLPTVGIVASASVNCSGVTVTLSANGAQSYTWLPGNVAGSSIFIAPTQNTVFSVTGVDANGCFGAATHTQLVHPTPIVSLTPSSLLVCPNEIFTITANGALNYTWQPGGNTGSQLVTSTNQLATFSVTGSSIYNCTASAIASVDVKPAPALSFNTNTITCASLGTATVFATGGTGPFSFSWSPVVQSGSVAVAMYPGVHTITVLDAGTGCVYTPTTSFNPLVPLTGTVSATSSINCNGLNTGTASIALSGGSGNEFYSWNSPAGTQTQSTASLLPAGITTVTVTDALTFCTVTQTFSITQPPALLVNISAASPTVCADASTSLSLAISGGIPAYSFTWTSGATVSTIPVSESDSGNHIYTVTGSDANGCLFSGSFSLGVMPNPTVSVPSMSICPLQAGVLTAGGASTYTWNTGFVGNVLVSFPSSTTHYTVTGSALGCTGTAMATLSVAATPTVNVSATNPRCSGDTLKLFSDSQVNYQWNGPGGFTSVAQNPVLPGILPTGSGPYILKVTAANGCTASSAVAVTVHPLPQLAAAGSTVCRGQTIQLWAGYLSGVSYAWSGPDLFSSTLQYILIPDAGFSHAGVYSVTISNNSTGCSNTGTVHVEVAKHPTPGVTGNNPICAGGTLSISGSGGTGYYWKGPSNFTSNQQTISFTNIKQGGFFTLSVLQGPCTSDTTILVLVHPRPVVSISGPSKVCDGSELQLSGGSLPAAADFSWTGPASTGNQAQLTIGQFFELHTGKYYLDVTDVNGCKNSDSLLVQLLPAPAISAVGATVCMGETALLTASGGVNYSWMGPAGFSSSSGNPMIQTVSAINAGHYSVVVTGSNACKSSTVVELVANPFSLPVVSARTEPHTACMEGEIRMVGSGGVTYAWQGPNGFSVDGQSATLSIRDYGMAGIYTLTAKNESNCAGAATVLVRVFPRPQMDISVTGNYTCVPFCADVNLVPRNNIAPVTSHSLLLKEAFVDTLLNRYCITRAGTQVLAVSYADTNNCVNTTTLAIVGYPKPIADFRFNPEKPTVKTDQVQFYNTSEPAQGEFTWYFQADSNSVKEKSPSFIFDQPGIQPVALVVTSQFGCSDTIIKTITVQDEFALYVPNAFTPGNDGLNDVFQPVGHGIMKYNLTVFDRWGELIFSSDDFLVGWDGTFKGRACKNDVYVWKIDLQTYMRESKIFTGKVILLRSVKPEE